LEARTINAVFKMRFSNFVLLVLTAMSQTLHPHPRNFLDPHKSHRSLAADTKLRGVNLGSLFVLEPWMVWKEWETMGCAGVNSEYDCVVKLGQAKADEVFQKHWDTWITESDMNQMKEYGLNAVRIPLGYWIVEEAVGSERFPRGGMKYLDRVVGWAAVRGMYVCLDLHGRGRKRTTLNLSILLNGFE